MPNTTTAVQRHVGPPIPVTARDRAVRVIQVEDLDAGTRFVADLSDRAHHFTVQISITAVRSHPVVTDVVAPDLDSILHSQPRPIPPPPGSSEAEQAARTFLAAYLAWLYGHGKASAIHAATPPLIAQLRGSPPIIPPTLQGLHAHLVALGMQRASGGWTALANVTDDHQTYQLTLAVIQARGRWRVSAVRTPS